MKFRIAAEEVAAAADHGDLGELRKAMLEMFGVSKGHNIKRNDKNQRGFNGVCLHELACGPPL